MILHAFRVQVRFNSRYHDRHTQIYRHTLKDVASRPATTNCHELIEGSLFKLSSVRITIGQGKALISREQSTTTV